MTSRKIMSSGHGDKMAKAADGFLGYMSKNTNAKDFSVMGKKKGRR